LKILSSDEIKIYFIMILQSTIKIYFIKEF